MGRLSTLFTVATEAIGSLVVPWAYHKTTPETRATGQGGPLQADGKGALHVVLTDGAGTPVTAPAMKTDDAALAPGAAFLPVGGIVDDTATDSADEGDGAVARLTARRALVVQLDAGAGGIVKQDDVGTFAPGTDYALPVGGLVDDTATDTADEGDFVAARYSARRAAMTSMDTLISGEDQTNNVMRVEEQGTPTVCTSDTQVKAAAGFLYAVIVQPTDAVPTAGSIIIYNNTAESGTAVLTINVLATAELGTAGPRTIPVNAVMSTGIYAGFTTTADVSVTLIWR